MKLFTFIVLLILTHNLFAQTNNYALEFDGINDHVVLGTDANLTSPDAPSTISCWFKNLDTLQSYSVFFGSAAFYNGGGYHFSYRSPLNSSVGSYTFTIVDSANPNHIHFQISDNSIWHHIAIRLDGTNANLFLDGDLIGSIPFAQLGNNTPTLYLGGDTDANGNLETGYLANSLLDDFTVWNKALSETEIEQYMICPPDGSEPDLAGYWNFEEGSGTTTADRTSNGNNGSLVSGVNWNTDAPPYSCTTSASVIETKTFSVELFPNPTQEEFTLSLSHQLSGQVIISNLLGQEVQKESFSSDQVSVDLQKGLPKGTYFVSVLNSEQNIVAVKKLIRQ